MPPSFYSKIGTLSPGAPASKRQERAAIRRLFDWLVKDQVLPFNPASSVRLKRYSVRTGKTPILDNADMKRLLESIETDTISGLRDRAIIGTMFYSFCRVGALVKIQTSDYYHHGRRSFLRLREKGGKEIEAPVHHALQGLLDAYLQAARLQMAFDAEDATAPLFRSLSPRRTLTSKPLDTSAVRYMVKRRKAGLYGRISPHSFRGTGITNYLEHGGQTSSTPSTSLPTPTPAPPSSTTGERSGSRSMKSSGSGLTSRLVK